MVALAVCVVIPPLVALWPAVLGSRFVVVAFAAALAAIVVWSVALFVVPPVNDDTGPLPFYALIHTFVTIVVVGIPWAFATQRRTPG